MPAILSERRISLAELAAREHVHASTVFRWCRRGCKGHRLESFSIGGKRFSTLEAWDRWMGKINEVAHA